MAKIEFVGKDTSFRMDYIDAWQFELGECFIDHRNVVYLLAPKYRFFAENMKRQLQTISYEDDAMELNFSPTIPHIFKEFETLDKERCIIFKKQQDTYPLKNILDYFGGEIDGKHIAWIISRLLNIETFLNYNNLVHNGISLNNCFINPKAHVMMLYGGWWYTKPVGGLMVGTNTDVYSCLANITKETKESNTFTDLESIKLIGRKISGLHATGFSVIPDSMYSFLTSKSSTDPRVEMSKWDDAKKEAYGKPKFIEMNLDPLKIYKDLKGDN